MADKDTTIETPVTEVTPEPASDVVEAPVKEPTPPAPEVTEEAVTSEDAPKEGEAEKPAEEVETPSDDDKAKKRHNDEMARQRINSQKTRQNVLKQVDDAYGPKTIEDLQAEGLEGTDARIEALRQEMQFEKTKNYIADLNTGLKQDAEQVLRDHPVFDESSKNYDPEFTKEVQEAYKQAARLQYDDNGIVINAELGLADFYSRMAKIREGGSQKGQVAGQQDALKMLSRTEPTGSTNTTSGEKSAQDMSIEEMEAKYGMVRR